MLHSLVCALLSLTSGTAGLLDGGEDDSDSESDLPSGAEIASSSGEEGSSDGEGLLLPSYCFTGRPSAQDWSAVPGKEGSTGSGASTRCFRDTPQAQGCSASPCVNGSIDRACIRSDCWGCLEQSGMHRLVPQTSGCTLQ